MVTVHIEPMPASIRALPQRLRSIHPPIFQGGEPTPEDIELACELFLALDAESQRWYAGCRVFAGLLT